MAASGYTITSVFDVPAQGSEPNIILGRRGQKLDEPSRVLIYLTRESVDVQAAVNIGGTEVLSQGPVNINTVNDTLPSTQDDKLIETFAQQGDDIIVSATNANVATQQLRVIVQVMPIDEAVVGSALLIQGRQT